MRIPICTVNLRSVTPSLVGGYDAQAYHEKLRIVEPFRLTELKGQMRWIGRALIAGASLDAYGLLDITNVKLILGRILGTAEEPEVHSSPVHMAVVKENSRVLQVVRKGKYDVWQEMTIPRAKELFYVNARREIPRVSLLLLNKRSVTLIWYDNVSLKMYATPYYYNKLNSLEKALFWVILFMMLTLKGLGKASRRGFGSLSFRIEDSYGHLHDLFKDVSDSEGELLIEYFTRHYLDEYAGVELLNILKLLINSSKRIARRVVEETKPKSGTNIPFLPIMARNLFEIDLISLRRSAYLSSLRGPALPMNMPGWFTALHFIGVLTKRQDWRRAYGGDPRMPSLSDKLRASLKWFLGLPRRVGSSGYIESCPPCERRASPLLFHVIQANDRSATLTVCKQISYDWPQKLIWSPGPKKRIQKLSISIRPGKASLNVTYAPQNLRLPNKIDLTLINTEINKAITALGGRSLDKIKI